MRNPDTVTAKSTSRVWIPIALIVSLGLNLLIAGVMIGRQSFSAAPERTHFGWMMSEFDENTRKMLHGEMRERMRQSQPSQEKLRTTLKQLHQVIRTEPFNEESARVAFSDVRDASFEFQEIMHSQMIATLGELKPEERLKVYRFLSDRQQPGGPFGRRDFQKETRKPTATP